jgi:hypothetical protein
VYRLYVDEVGNNQRQRMGVLPHRITNEERQAIPLKFLKEDMSRWLMGTSNAYAVALQQAYPALKGGSNGSEAFARHGRARAGPDLRRRWALGAWGAGADALGALIAGRPVECQPIGRDRYGRTVARCYAGGQDLGAAMVAAGWAWPRE